MIILNLIYSKTCHDVVLLTGISIPCMFKTAGPDNVKLFQTIWYVRFFLELIHLTNYALDLKTINNVKWLPNVDCVIPLLTSVVTTSTVKVVDIGSSEIFVSHHI